MTKEHELLERIAVGLDDKADDIFGDISNGQRPSADGAEAQAFRRAAEIIRYQIECEA